MSDDRAENHAVVIALAEEALTQNVYAIDWTRTAFAVWFFGFFAAILPLPISAIRAARLLRASQRIESGEWLGLLREIKTRLGIQHEIELFFTNERIVPMTWGFTRSIVLLPATCADWTQERKRVVLIHELAHIARRDLHWRVRARVACAIHWFNPLAWYALRRLRNEQEFACDDCVVHAGERASDYAAELVGITESHQAPRLSLAVPMAQSSHLESRLRSLFDRAQSHLPLDQRTAAAFLIIGISVSCVVSLIHPIAANADDVTTAAPSERPGIAELTKSLAGLEEAYLPYHVKTMETFRMSEGLTPTDKRRYPWADGRKHQRKMEYGQRELGVWLRKETMLIDGNSSQQFDQYSDGEVETKVSHYNGALQPIYLEKNYSQLVFNSALAGVFPLSVYGNGLLLSDAIEGGDVKPQLAWDGDDARLTFAFGPGRLRGRYVMWLSRENDWHPIKLQRFRSLSSKLFFTEWEVTGIVEEAGQWRVKAGTIRTRHYDAERQDAKVIYSTDFVVLSAEYGETVTADRFQFDIPENAEVVDSRKPKPVPAPPTKTREVTVTVVDLNENPIHNAVVRFATKRGNELDRVTTDAKGIAASAKAPADDVSIQVSAPSYRKASWLIWSGGKEHRVRLAPVTHGIARNEAGEPLGDIWITSKPFGFGQTGLPQIPRHESAQRENDWSDGDGKFVLDTELTLRGSTRKVRLVAVDDDARQMAFAFVSPTDLNKPQTLTLNRTCEVQAEFVLENAAQKARVHAIVKDSEGREVAQVVPAQRLEDGKLYATFKLRLPAGNKYFLVSRPSPLYPQFALPIDLEKERGAVDLGSIDIAASDTSALRGKPAPALSVAWRNGDKKALADFRGRVVVLDFWGHWCVPCVKDIPELMAIADRFKGEQVEWIAIHNPSVSTVNEMDAQIVDLQHRLWKDRELPFHMVLDDAANDGDRTGITGKRYGLVTWPMLVVIDPRGNMVGPIEKEDLAATIASLLKQDSGGE